MTETREQRAERVYAQAERSLDAMNARRVRRGPEVLLAVLVVLTLGVGAVVATDLRRLMTPTGTALAWTGAATFGDCKQYDRLSVAPDRAADPRGEDDRCAALQERTLAQRADSSRYGIELVDVQRDGDEASAQVRITTPDRTAVVRLPLVRVEDGWAVVRTDEVCRAVGCV